MAFKKIRIKGKENLFSYIRNINGEERVFYGFDKWIGCRYQQVIVEGKKKNMLIAGKRVEKKGFKSKRDAEKALMSLIANTTYDPASMLNPKVKLSELTEKWIERQSEKDLAEEYLNKCKKVLEEFKLVTGNLEIDKIGEPHLLAYVKYLRNIDNQRKRKCHESTISLHVGIVKGCLNSAKRFYPKLMWNPPRLDRVIKVVERVEPEVTVEMILAIIDALRDINTPRSMDVADMVLIASQTALRVGEVISLTWFNVRFAKRASAPYGHLAFISEKTRRSALIPMTKNVSEVLFERFKKRLGEKVFDWDIPFNSMRARVAEMLRRGCDRASITYGRDNPDGLRFHSFRHFVARALLDEGVDLATVGGFGRWSRTSMVMLYGKANLSGLFKAMKVMDNLNLRLGGQNSSKRQEPESGGGAKGSVLPFRLVKVKKRDPSDDKE